MMAKLRWRRADAAAETGGEKADVTVWATTARSKLFVLLDGIHHHGMLIRIRHRYIEEAFLLVAESRYRDLEHQARGETHGDPGVRRATPGRQPPPFP